MLLLTPKPQLQTWPRKNVKETNNGFELHTQKLMKNQEKEVVEAEEEEKLIISNGKTKNEDINVLINKFQKKKRRKKIVA